MRRSILIWLCTMVLLCGCGNRQVQPVPTASQEVPEPEPEKKQQESEKKKNGSEDIIQKLNKLSQKGRVMVVQQGKESLFLVLNSGGKDKVCFLDVRTGEMTEKELPCNVGKKAEVQLTKGYMVIYDNERTVIVLDHDLTIVNKITVKKSIAKEGLHRNYCVLPNEKKIVYTKEVLENGEMYQEVNECGYSGNKKRKICKIEDAPKSVGKVNEITKFAASEDEKTLFFEGLYYKTAGENATSFPCFGRINRNTGEVVSVQEEKYMGSWMGNTMMFVDGLKEKGTPSSGYITCLTDQGDGTEYSFRRKEESQEVTVSDKGMYFLSYETNDDEKTTDISCYSFEGSEYQWEKKLPHYVSAIWYYEQEKQLLYSFYNDSGKLRFQKEDVSK